VRERAEKRAWNSCPSASGATSAAQRTLIESGRNAFTPRIHDCEARDKSVSK
jgi:hypothetical protein